MPHWPMAERGFEVGTAIQFIASHVMPGVEGPEGTLHEHDYRLEVLVSRNALDERGMVCDLDVLDAVLDDLREQVEGRNLDFLQTEGQPAVTVEVFAEWAHAFLARNLAGAGADSLAVRVWESDVAFGGFRDRLG